VHDFDRDIAVTADGEGRHAAHLDAGWSVGGGLNGGFLLAVIGSALRATVPETPDPVAVSAHYLGAGTPGEAEVRTRVVRRGRSLATVGAELWQADQPRITALATMGDLTGLPGDASPVVEPPALPPPEECLGREHTPPEARALAPLTERFDLRLDPDCVGWAVGSPSGRGLIQGWFRFEGGREPDPLALLLAVDALPPATFDLGRPGWAPTLELSVYLRATPAPGWLRLRHATRHVAGGMFEEDCEVWDGTGRLVAQSRQLARTPR
jgi:acyl-coenzyme A thioesterase PaaI-like protein